MNLSKWKPGAAITRREACLTTAATIAWLLATNAENSGADTGATLAIKADLLYTVSGAPLKNGVVLIRSGKIVSVGSGSQIPAGVKTIHAAIDFSSATKPVVAEAVTLARGRGARLVALHVVQPTVVTDSEVWAQMKSEYDALTTAAAKKQLAELQKQLKSEGVMIEAQHIVGLPGPCILDQAVALKADYIVLGSHGHGAFYDLIIGSTASRVLKQAPCPVVVVPPGNITRKAPRPAASSRSKARR